MTESLVCWNCGKSLSDIPLPVSRHANCSACFEVLHCCRMCRHYAPDKRPYCSHERADPPIEKETANFCDYFKPANRFSGKVAERSGRAKSELDSLFGDTGDVLDTASNEVDVDVPEPLNKLDDLFDD